MRHFLSLHFKKSLNSIHVVVKIPICRTLEKPHLYLECWWILGDSVPSPLSVVFVVAVTDVGHMLVLQIFIKCLSVLGPILGPEEIEMSNS